jgi:decaprenylphospho-beta-D-erythro-pentofuranosid-2-ulose 2-reductase
MSKNIVIIGATSLIAQHAAKIWAKENAEFLLVGRDDVKLSRVKEDLMALGATRITVIAQDLLDTTQHSLILEEAKRCFDRIDILLMAHGTLLNQLEIQSSSSLALTELNANFLSHVSILIQFTPYFERQGSGSIGVISSVAGERGRMSNYVYGSAKAGLSVFTEGLRNRLYHRGVSVTLIKPGIVETPMTASLGLTGPLVANPAKVGRDIACALNHKCKEVYTPFFWRYIMLVIRCLPNFLFDRLKM